MDLIERFCAEYHPYHDISDARRRQQATLLREFRDSLGHPLEQLEAEDFRRFLAAQIERGLAPSTVGKHTKMLRPFFDWLRRQRVIDAETLLDLRDVKPPRGANGSGQPRPYTRNEIGRMWVDLGERYPWCYGKNRSQERALRLCDRWLKGQSKWKVVEPLYLRRQVEAIACLALMGGLRRDEIFRMTAERLHPDNSYIVVEGARKNAAAETRVRAVPWVGGDLMREKVGAWLDLRERLDPEHDGAWLAVYRDLRRAPLRHQRFKLLLTRAGGWEFHRLRHTFATEALRAGMPLEQLQKILGHATPQQTLRYAQIVEVDVVRAAARIEADFSRTMAKALAA